MLMWGDALLIGHHTQRQWTALKALVTANMSNVSRCRDIGHHVEALRRGSPSRLSALQIIQNGHSKWQFHAGKIMDRLRKTLAMLVHSGVGW